MLDSAEVVVVLREARDLVSRDWGSTDPDCVGALGACCASVAIQSAASVTGISVIDEAHVALLRGAGLPVPANIEAAYEAVYRFNDSQPDPSAVLRAFDNAIATLEPLSVAA